MDYDRVRNRGIKGDYDEDEDEDEHAAEAEKPQTHMDGHGHIWTWISYMGQAHSDAHLNPYVSPV